MGGIFNRIGGHVFHGDSQKITLYERIPCTNFIDLGSGMIKQENVSLREFNTFDLEVKARFLVTISDENSLERILDEVRHSSLPKLILGGGSNVLFKNDYHGVVIKNEILGREVIQENSDSVWIRLGAGEDWHQVVLWAIDQGWGGIENLSLIPGTVGAAPMQNIGAYGVEICSVFVNLEAMNLQTGKSCTFDAAACKFGYRQSVFKGPLKNQFVITRVVLKLHKHPRFNLSYGDLQQTLAQMGADKPSLKTVSDAVIQIRQSKLPDPESLGNAGSFFKNPLIDANSFNNLKTEYANIPHYPTEGGLIKIPAGWLIEQCNWKGFRRGAVGVHEKQALVLVNYGGASGTELVQLSNEIKQSVHGRFGIELTPEVNIISA